MTAFEGLREPISEGVRVMLIGLLEDVVKNLQQAIRWLQALDPRRNTLTGDDVVVTAVPGAHGNTNKSRERIRAAPLGPEVITDAVRRMVRAAVHVGPSRSGRPARCS
jgi:hypothetical protein